MGHRAESGHRAASGLSSPGTVAFLSLWLALGSCRDYLGPEFDGYEAAAGVAAAAGEGHGGEGAEQTAPSQSEFGGTPIAQGHAGTIGLQAGEGEQSQAPQGGGGAITAPTAEGGSGGLDEHGAAAEGGGGARGLAGEVGAGGTTDGGTTAGGTTAGGTTAGGTTAGGTTAGGTTAGGTTAGGTTAGGTTAGGTTDGGTTAGGTTDGGTTAGGTTDGGASAGVSGSDATGGAAGGGSGGSQFLPIPATTAALAPPRRPQLSVVDWQQDESGTTRGIPVCFLRRPRYSSDGSVICPEQLDDGVDCVGEAPPPGAPSLVDLWEPVLEAILDTWQRAARIELHIWRGCPVEEATDLTHDDTLRSWIVIGFGNHDIADWIGHTSSGPAGVYADWRKLMAGDYSGLIRTFGHALGVGAEWNKPQYELPAYCQTPPDGYDGLGYLHPSLVDYGATMGGCFPLDPGPQLSPGDATSIQSLFNRHDTHTVLSYEGQCLSLRDRLSSAAYSNYGFPCRLLDHQRWRWIPERRTLQTSLNETELCLQVYGATVSPIEATNAVSATCTGLPAQQFSLRNSRWQALGTWCVSAEAGSLVAEPCSTLSDHWHFFDMDPDTTLEFTQIGLAESSDCVALPSNAHVGDSLTLSPCDPADPLQRFEVPGDGILLNEGLCISAPASELRGQAVPLVLSDQCTASPVPFATQFHLSGEIRALGQCLTLAGSNTIDFDFKYPVMLPCEGGNASQRWDYYF